MCDALFNVQNLVVKLENVVSSIFKCRGVKCCASQQSPIYVLMCIIFNYFSYYDMK